jgi:hypothetical protein
MVVVDFGGILEAAGQVGWLGCHRTDARAARSLDPVHRRSVGLAEIECGSISGLAEKRDDDRHENGPQR